MSVGINNLAQNLQYPSQSQEPWNRRDSDRSICSKYYGSISDVETLRGIGGGADEEQSGVVQKILQTGGRMQLERL